MQSCPFCALNFTFARQGLVYFLLCQVPAINVQADFFDNNFGLYSNSQRENQYRTSSLLLLLCHISMRSSIRAQGTSSDTSNFPAD